MCSRQQRVHDCPRQLQRLQYAPEQVAINTVEVRADFVGVQFGGPEQFRDMGQGNLGRDAWLNGKECGLADRVAGDVEGACGEDVEWLGRVRVDLVQGAVHDPAQEVAFFSRTRSTAGRWVGGDFLGHR